MPSGWGVAVRVGSGVSVNSTVGWGVAVDVGVGDVPQAERNTAPMKASNIKSVAGRLDLRMVRRIITNYGILIITCLVRLYNELVKI